MSLQDLIQDNYNSIIVALQVMVSSFFSLCCIDTSGSLEKSPYSPVPSLPPVLSCFCTLSWCFYWACESFILKHSANVLSFKLNLTKTKVSPFFSVRHEPLILWNTQCILFMVLCPSLQFVICALSF